MSIAKSSHLVKVIPFITLMLAGCVSTPPSQGPTKSPDSAQWRHHQAQVSQVTQFESRGAFAYLSDQHRVYARFNWQQQAEDRYRLRLTSPIGSTELQLDQQGSTVQLVDNKGQRYLSRNAEEMVSTLTGMQIPLANLRQWMIGLPGQATSFTLNNDYLLHTADYSVDGVTWHVVINNYTHQKNVMLPASLELSTAGQRIKLRIDNWVIQ